MRASAAILGRRRHGGASEGPLLNRWADGNGGLEFDFTRISSSRPFGTGKIIDGATPANNWKTTSSLTPFDKLTFTRASTAMYYNSAGVLTQAASGVARIDYDPSTLAVRGLLVEEQRTNLCLRSQEFDNASWTKDSSTVNANAIAAPDGTTTADLVTSAAATAATGVTSTGISVSAVAHTFSIFIKANGVQFVQLLFSGGLSTNYANFNISTGAVTAGTYTDAGVQNIGNGYYRLFVTATLSAATGNIIVAFIDGGSAARAASFTGDGAKGAYLWGAQLEAGAFASSYIPTSSASATRAADAVSLATSAFNNSATAGTLYVGWTQTVTASQAGMLLNLGDGTGNEQHMLLQSDAGITGAGTRFTAQTADGAVGQNAFDFAAVSVANHKMAYAFAANDTAGSLNAGTVLTDTSVTLPTVTTLYVGQRNGALHCNGHIRQVMHLPRRLTNTQLQTLTT